MKTFYLWMGMLFIAFTAISCNDVAPTPPLHPGYGGIYPTNPSSTPSTGSTTCFSFSFVSVPNPATVSTTAWSAGVSVATYAIRSLADWQAYCGSTNPPSPPVDLNTQMILVYYETIRNGWCGGQITFSSVCQASNQLTVSVSYVNGEQGTMTIGAPPSTVVQAVTIPISGFPVSWSVTNLPLNAPCPL